MFIEATKDDREPQEPTRIYVACFKRVLAVAQTRSHTITGAPNDNFWKISVRKMI